PRLLKKMILLEQLPLLTLATVIAQARFFLGNDSGISHLAAALGIPSFVIFGPTAPGIWHPWGPKVKIFAPKVSCAPCGDEERRNCPNRICLESIKPEEVINVIKTQLSEDEPKFGSN
ncbi:MAG: glycosyltransferase family 9 protein, partial [Candidatus Desulfofervidaceae bacterium]|nr:glycosyltransferase family 9 protein [Candidatus Desulfofervidaceae bacterium]